MASIATQKTLWNAFKRRKFPVVIQRESVDCSACCLAMISASLGRRHGVRFLRGLIGVGHAGASLYALARACGSIGLEATGVRATIGELPELKTPFIAVNKVHYVVVYEVTNGSVVIGDPSAGLIETTLNDFADEWTGIALLMKPTDRFFLGPESHDSNEFVMRIFRSERRHIAALILITAVVHSVSILAVFKMKDAFNVIYSSTKLSTIFLPLYAVGACYMGSVIFKMAGSMLSASLAKRLEITLSSSVFRRILDLPLSYHQARRSSDLIKRVGDLDRLKDFIAFRGITTATDLALMVLYIVAILNISWQFALIAITGAAFLAFIISLLSAVSNKLLCLENKLINDSYLQLSEAIKSIFTVKALGIEDIVFNRWLASMNRSCQQSKMRYVIQSIINGAGDFSAKFVPFAALGVALHQYSLGRMHVGDIIGVSSLVGSFMVPISNMASVRSDVDRTIHGVNCAGDVLTTKTLSRGLVSSGLDASCFLELANVSYRYGSEDEPLILKNLSVSIPTGQLTVIMGPSGSGKSTMLHIMANLLTPQEGSVRLHGVPLAQIDSQVLRSQIGIVSQESKLFAGTIFENVTFGCNDVDEDLVWHCLSLADADNFVRSLPRSLNFPLVDDGVGLSGGQKQRIMLARALYRRPQLLLLDEATSALDATSSRRIFRMLREMSRRFTTVFVTHDQELSNYAQNSILLTPEYTLLSSV